MSTRSSDLSSEPLTERARKAIQRLMFQIEVPPGRFWFGVIVSPSPASLDVMLHAARVACQRRGLDLHVHAPAVDELVKLAFSLREDPAPGLHWIQVVDDTPAGEEAAAALLLRMNERRDSYRRRLDGAIVIAGPLSLKRMLRELAPDLFTIRAFILEPGSDPGTARASEGEPPPPAEAAAASTAPGEVVSYQDGLARLKASFPKETGAFAEALLKLGDSLSRVRQEVLLREDPQARDAELAYLLAMKTFTELGLLEGVALARAKLALLYQQQDRLAEADRLYGQALGLTPGED